jgi:hypothetical protein
MKTISILPVIALFGVVAASAAPPPHRIDGNPCEYFGMDKEWCVDGTLDPEFYAHMGDWSVNQHAAGSKRDDSVEGYEWPEDDFMSIHEMTEFEKRSDNHDPKLKTDFKRPAPIWWDFSRQVPNEKATTEKNENVGWRL